MIRLRRFPGDPHHGRQSAFACEIMSRSNYNSEKLPVSISISFHGEQYLNLLDKYLYKKLTFVILYQGSGSVLFALCVGHTCPLKCALAHNERVIVHQTNDMQAYRRRVKG